MAPTTEQTFNAFHAVSELNSKNYARFLFDIINEKNFIITGSFVHKLMSGLDYTVGDIDIIVNNRDLNKINALFKNNMKKVEISEDIYGFSKHIVGMYTLKRCPKISVIHIDTSYEKFINEEIVFDFLRCYYQNKKFHHSNKFNARVENITSEKYSSDHLSWFIIKYEMRGVKFNTIYEKLEVTPEVQSAMAPLEIMKKKYQDLGLVVIPLNTMDSAKAGKCPAVKGWKDKDTNYDFDVAKCRSGNIGILCGPNSGIMCIDVDVKDDGLLHFTRLIKKYRLPKGPYQETPNGGNHYVFKYNPERMKDMKARIKFFKKDGNKVGVDFWAKDVQFVAEPSINKTNGKSYKWVVSIFDTPIPELPEWLYDLYECGNVDGRYNICMPDDESDFDVITPISSAHASDVESNASTDSFEQIDVDDERIVEFNNPCGYVMSFLKW